MRSRRGCTPPGNAGAINQRGCPAARGHWPTIAPAAAAGSPSHGPSPSPGGPRIVTGCSHMAKRRAVATRRWRRGCRVAGHPGRPTVTVAVQAEPESESESWADRHGVTVTVPRTQARIVRVGHSESLAGWQAALTGRLRVALPVAPGPAQAVVTRLCLRVTVARARQPEAGPGLRRRTCFPYFPSLFMVPSSPFF